jgi:hypothetical protein
MAACRAGQHVARVGHTGGPLQPAHSLHTAVVHLCSSPIVAPAATGCCLYSGAGAAIRRAVVVAADRRVRTGHAAGGARLPVSRTRPRGQLPSFPPYPASQELCMAVSGGTGRAGAACSKLASPCSPSQPTALPCVALCLPRSWEDLFVGEHKRTCHNCDITVTTVAAESCRRCLRYNLPGHATQRLPSPPPRLPGLATRKKLAWGLHVLVHSCRCLPGSPEASLNLNLNLQGVCLPPLSALPPLLPPPGSRIASTPCVTTSRPPPRSVAPAPALACRPLPPSPGGQDAAHAKASSLREDEKHPDPLHPSRDPSRRPRAQGHGGPGGLHAAANRSGPIAGPLQPAGGPRCIC